MFRRNLSRRIATYKLVHYAHKHPETHLTVFEIEQIPGYRGNSHSTKDISESLSTTPYAVPIALVNPYLFGGVFVDYLIRGRYHLAPKNPEMVGPEDLTALTEPGDEQQNAASAGTHAADAVPDLPYPLQTLWELTPACRKRRLRLSKPKTQSFSNHGRFDPPFHFFLAIVLLVNVIVAIVYLIRHMNLAAGWFFVLSVAGFVALAKIRSYPLKVQDRVIRLEERLRLQALAPAEWHTQIYRLSEDQLIGLRFAADDEVVELAKQAVEHNLNRKQIKERIKDWRADEFRV